MVINLKNKLWIILILVLLIGIGGSIYFFTKSNNSNKSDYISSRTSTDEQNDTNTNTNTNTDTSATSNVEQNNENEKNTIEITQNATGAPQKKEEEISSFSTKIYNKESSRQNNVSITCSSLNDTIVPNGSTFSFCNTVGQATTARGYQKADIFDKDGNKKKGLGGGNCQVSTTLYNAILKVPSLTVTERHQHSNKVPYIQNGKDAAVAYGSYDLKFVNNTGFDIKIKANNSNDAIAITLFKLVEQ